MWQLWTGLSEERDIKYKIKVKLDYLCFYWVIGVLYIFLMFLIRYMICKCFLPFCWLCFCFLDGILWNIKVVNFMKSSLSIFLVTCIFSVISKKSLSNHSSQIFTSVFLFRSFKVLALMFHPFWVNFLCKVWGRSPASFFCKWVSSCLSTITKTVLFTLNCLGTLVESHLSINMRVYFGLKFLFHRSLYPYASVILSWVS